MASLLHYYLIKTIWILVIPFFYWFGTNFYFIEIVNAFQELADIQGFYFLAFLLVGAVLYYRNSLFNFLKFRIFKSSINFLNNLPFLTFTKFFYTKIRNLFSIFGKKLYKFIFRK